ncbi:hypothetical protein ADU37_CDS21510 [Thermococcus sp. 2319x1]|nr:hypothetical protein ADU37_CDS21510 [Thermococcus sp. 2319x1]
MFKAGSFFYLLLSFDIGALVLGSLAVFVVSRVDFILNFAVASSMRAFWQWFRFSA